jgi:hypothetical protein
MLSCLGVLLPSRLLKEAGLIYLSVRHVSSLAILLTRCSKLARPVEGVPRAFFRRNGKEDAEASERVAEVSEADYDRSCDLLMTFSVMAGGLSHMTSHEYDSRTCECR